MTETIAIKRNIFLWNQALFMAVLNPIFQITGKISEKRRNFLLFICMLLLMPIYVVRITRLALPLPISFSETQWGVLGCVFLFAIIVFSQKEKLCLLPVNKWHSLVAYLFPALILLSSIDHPVGAGLRLYSLAALFGFPCLYFVWAGRGDFDTLFRYLSWALVLSGFVFFALSMPTFFSEGTFVGGRYYGITRSPNAVGAYFVANSLGAFYLFFNAKGKGAIVPILSIFICVGMTMLASSRTAIFSIALMFIFGAILEFAKKKRGTLERKELQAKLFFLIVAAACSSVAILLFVFHSGIMENVLASEASELFTNLWGRMTAFFREGVTVDQASAYRTEIWRLYIDGITMRGKDFYVEPVLWMEGATGAHNTVLDLSYRCGILAGIAYLLFVLWSLASVFRNCSRKSGNARFFLFPCMAGISFLVYSMVEVVGLSAFYYCVVFCFFVSISPLMFQFEQREEMGENIQQSLKGKY